MAHWSWGIAVDPLVMVTILAIVGGAFWEVVKVVRRIDKRNQRFQEDWEGSMARPGVDARAGVMERLQLIEVHQSDTNTRIEELSQQIKGIKGQRQ